MVRKSIDQTAVNKFLTFVFMLALVGGAYFLGVKSNQPEGDGSTEVAEQAIVEEKTEEKPVAPVVKEKVDSVESYLENGNFKKADEALGKVPEAQRDREWKQNKIRSLEGLGETNQAIAIIDDLMLNSNRAQKASLTYQKAEILIDSGEKDKAGDYYYELFVSYSDTSEAEKATLKLKELWKPLQNKRDIPHKKLIQYNLVLSWVIQNSIDETMRKRQLSSFGKNQC